MTAMPVPYEAMRLRAPRLPLDMSQATGSACAVLGLVILSEAPVAMITALSLNAALGALVNLIWLTAHVIGLIGVLSLAGRTPGLMVLLPVWLLIVTNYLSAGWSIDRAETVRMATFYMGTALFGMWLGTRATSWTAFAKLLVFTCGLLASLSVILIALPGPLGIMIDPYPGAWSGLWDEKNRFAMTLVVGLVASIGLWLEGRGPGWLVPAFAFIGLILLAQASTALLAASAGIAVLMLVRVLNARPGLGLALGWAGTCAFASLLGVLIALPQVVVSAVGREVTLTGRTDIWGEVLRMIADWPVLGYGHGSFWRMTPDGPAEIVRENLGFKMFNSHSGWLDAALDTGVLGVAIISAATLVALVITLRAGLRVRGAGLGTGLIAVCLVYSLTESQFFQANALLPTIFVAVLARAGVSLARIAAATRPIALRSSTGLLSPHFT
jgi:O-antigen ligase